MCSIPSILKIGEVNKEKIQANVRGAISKKFPLYCLGFGFDVNFEFLSSMSLENNGVARRIYQESDAALQLQVTTTGTGKNRLHLRSHYTLHIVFSQSSHSDYHTSNYFDFRCTLCISSTYICVLIYAQNYHTSAIFEGPN